MGQEIVSRESPKELGGRRRLSLYEDILFVLKNNIGTEVVEGIKLNTPIEIEEHLSAEAFSKMKKLRLLKIGYEQPPQDLIRSPVQLPQGLSYLSNELRAIDWHGYPLKSMPANFQPNKLVELRMHYSNIKQLWKGIMILNELKLIDLSDSQNLIEIPDLSGVPNLKQLILQRFVDYRLGIKDVTFTVVDYRFGIDDVKEVGVFANDDGLGNKVTISDESDDVTISDESDDEFGFSDEGDRENRGSRVTTIINKIEKVGIFITMFINKMEKVILEDRGVGNKGS
ncbi:hypothetical protein CMV_026414 [Castanea mollissima]|uniref:Uncharacterized protein n=1 Tax=Castanea mollissima TaxID=60419 RepID=A0A8J4QK56_9ROSI|nr:hypothetical protein CMV_026414 [Castanea mollissima]